MKKRFLLLAFSATLCLPMASQAAGRAPESLYPTTCAACHKAGMANAPKAGDAAAWQALIDAKGIDALVGSTKTGLNAMPPKGMCMDCTDDEYKALIEYMKSM